MGEILHTVKQRREYHARLCLYLEMWGRLDDGLDPTTIELQVALDVSSSWLAYFEDVEEWTLEELQSKVSLVENMDTFYRIPQEWLNRVFVRIQIRELRRHVRRVCQQRDGVRARIRLLLKRSGWTAKQREAMHRLDRANEEWLDYFAKYSDEDEDEGEALWKAWTKLTNVEQFALVPHDALTQIEQEYINSPVRTRAQLASTSTRS